jgi:hypothetical protein
MRSRDNERPKRKIKVHAFQAQGRAITNEEVRRRRSHIMKQILKL